MSDGKRSSKRDVVILSIKPKRPEYPPDKKAVAVKEVLQEWDKLDAYYRGQILKLQTHQKTTKSHVSRTSRKSSRKHSTSLSSRRSTTGTQLTELFGDENIPMSDDDVELSDYNDDDVENTLPPKSKHKRDISLNSNKKSSGKKLKEKSEPSKSTTAVEDDENYLSVPRDNFVIEFAISLKKRTPLHRPDSGNAGYISPIKVERYKPPIAIGFNGVHIQKILYHKSDGSNHTSPTTTAPTPTSEKPTDCDSPFLNNTSGVDSKRESPCDKNNIISNTGIDNGNVIKRENVSSRMSIGNKVNMKLANNDDSKNIKEKEKRSSMVSPLMKRKMDRPDNISSGSGPVTSTTNSLIDELFEIPAKRPNKEKIKDKPALTLITDKDKLTKTLKTTCPTTKSLSITDTIIRKAKDNAKSPEMKERERRRRIESQKRKAYAMEKIGEQFEMDHIDVSIKAFEMIATCPLLSPLRSP